MNQPQPLPATPSPDESPCVGTTRVVLIQTGGAAAWLQPLALALARQGHSLALWPTPPTSEPDDQPDLLDLQLAIERAGGISLAMGESRAGWDATEATAALTPPPGAVTAQLIDAFGRLDVAIAWGVNGAALMARALDGLERRARADLLLVLLPGAPVGEQTLPDPPPGGMARPRAVHTRAFGLGAIPTSDAIGAIVEAINPTPANDSGTFP